MFKRDSKSHTFRSSCMNVNISGVATLDSSKKQLVGVMQD